MSYSPPSGLRLKTMYVSRELTMLVIRVSVAIWTPAHSGDTA